MASRFPFPLNRFDMWAGAKAIYERLGVEWNITPEPWENMTAEKQKVWVNAMKAGIIAAQKTKRAKATGTSQT